MMQTGTRAAHTATCITYFRAVSLFRPTVRCIVRAEPSTFREVQGAVARGDQIPLTCSRLAHNGQGVCFWSEDVRKVVVFCAGALPGEAVLAEVTKQRKTYWEARKVQTTTASPLASLQHPCQYASVCGGCQMQEFPYQEQINLKQDRLRFELAQIAKLADVDTVLHPVIEAPQPFRYRNKITFTVTSSASGSQLALQAARTNDSQGHVCVSSCLLQSEHADRLLQLINATLKHPSLRGPLTSFDPATRTGFLKRCVIMESNMGSRKPSGTVTQAAAPYGGHQKPASERSLRVNWITNGNGSVQQQQALAKLSEQIYSSGLVSVSGAVQSVHSSVNVSAPVDSVQVLCGEGVVHASVLGVQYRISPNAFFQVNWHQAEALFSEVVRAADLLPEDTALDLYCGAGALTLQLSRRCRSVVGVDVVPAAVDDARANAELNCCNNVSFCVADLRAKLAKDKKAFKSHVLAAKAQVLVADPGRAGLSDAVKEFIAQDQQARRVVYVSCNSETMCRDIRWLSAGGRWKCVSVVGLDMFPQTDHLEQVAVLERCKEPGSYR